MAEHAMFHTLNMPSDDSTHAAPALARGIQILRLLGEHGAMSLEELSRRLELPKSSLLRLAETLQSLELIERKPDKKFAALAVLRANSAQEQSRRELIEKWLAECAADTGFTLEWYEWTRERTALEIVQRREAPTGDVVVRARQGFNRVLTEELEAVCQVALAFGGVAPGDTYWQWCMNGGDVVQERVADVAKVLRTVKRDGYGADPGYNLHGVRRLAFPIFSASHLVAVAAVALSYRPDGEKIFSALVENMPRSVARLQAQLDLLHPTQPSQKCP
jgi:DNA-binding IclR family transcriptional regulator